MNEAPFGEHEEWRPIPSLPAGYEASDLGRIRSWRHRKGTASSPLIRKPVKHTKYGHMSMMFYVDKKFVCRLVHHLVLDAFGIARLPNTETRHIDESGVDAAKRCGVTPAVITRIRRSRGYVR
jgi:hypothetical protein